MNFLTILGAGLNILGGLGIFLFGLKLLSENLQRLSSNKLKSILGYLTKNKLMGLGFGAVVTSILQSSSATTVILVGFANAGVIKLTQSISIIFGANIGTTITAQIIAFKASNIALPLIGIGAVLFLFFSEKKIKYIGEILIGLGLLFFGLKMMGTYLQPLKDYKPFLDLMISLGQYPILGVITGVIITVIVQSSSATTGMIITLGTLGLIDLQTAFVLELGSNVGTTITAQIAAIGTNVTAKRVAWAHTLFNVIGSAYMLVFLYIKIDGEPVFLKVIDSFTPGDGFKGENIERHIANGHTIFNIANAVILFPFISVIARITEKIVPERGKQIDTDIKFIDDRMVTSPTIALNQAQLEIKRQLQITKNITSQVYKAVFKNKPRALYSIKENTNTISHLGTQTIAFLINVSSKIDTDEEAVLCNELIHISENCMRISERALNIINLKQEDNLDLNIESLTDLKQLFQLINESFFELVQTFPEHNKETEIRLQEYTSISKALEHQINREYIKDIRQKNISPKSGYYIGAIIDEIQYIRDLLQKILQSLKQV